MSSSMRKSFTPWTPLAVYHIDQTLRQLLVLALPSQPSENFSTLASSILKSLEDMDRVWQPKDRVRSKLQVEWVTGKRKKGTIPGDIVQVAFIPERNIFQIHFIENPLPPIPTADTKQLSMETEKRPSISAVRNGFNRRDMELVLTWMTMMVRHLRLEQGTLRDHFAYVPTQFVIQHHQPDMRALYAATRRASRSSSTPSDSVAVDGEASQPSFWRKWRTGALQRDTWPSLIRIGRQEWESEMLDWMHRYGLESDQAQMLHRLAVEAPCSATEEQQYRQFSRRIGSTRCFMSPLIHMPAPFLLQRLEKEEEQVNEERRTNSLKKVECQSSKGPESMLERNNSLATLMNQYMPSNHDQMSVNALLSQQDTVEARMKQEDIHILCSTFVDPRAETSSAELMDPDSRPLLPPCCSKLDRFTYYDYEESSDTSLSEFIKVSVENAESSCPYVHRGNDDSLRACNVAMRQHVLSFLHGQGRVNVRVQRLCDTDAEDLPAPVDTLASAEEDRIRLWTCCTACRRCTPLLDMHQDTTAHYSFAKYFELMIYNPLFTCHQVGLCSQTLDKNHIGAHPDHRCHLKRCFTYMNYVVTFQYQPIDLHEVSVPNHFADSLLAKNSAADDYGWTLQSQQFESLSTLLSTYWTHINDYLKSFELELRSSGSKVLVEYIGLFREHLRLEEKSMNELFKLTEQDMQRVEKSQHRSRSVTWNPEAVFVSSSLTLRGLRKTLHDKMVAIDREISHWHETIVHDFPRMSRLSLYETSIHPDSAWRDSQRTHEDRQPGSILALALQSPEVLDLMGILDDVVSLIDLFPDDIDHDTILSTTDESVLGSWMTQAAIEIERVMRDGKFPMKFETKHDDGTVVEAKMVDGMHIHYHRTPASSSNQKSSQPSQGSHVTIYYAHMFHVLRTRYGISGERFSESLASSQPWQPTGGKSGSQFFTTDDGNFVMKSLGKRRKRVTNAGTKSASSSLKRGLSVTSAATMNSHASNDSEWVEDVIPNEEERKMMVQFAPKYLEYMLRRVKPHSQTKTNTGHPSLMVKMLGIYSIKGRRSGDQDNSATMRSYETNLVVMEQLFRGRQVQQKFDLKGIRTRTVDGNTGSRVPFIRLVNNVLQGSSQKNTASLKDRRTTLWDGNWIETMYDSTQQGFGSTTLFIHPHSKYLLRQALYNDTEFLKQSNIVDYSLLVGVDEEKNQLVMGIVDYIGEYTIWKKLENKGKTTLLYLENKVKEVAQTVGLAGSKHTDLALDEADVSIQEGMPIMRRLMSMARRNQGNMEDGKKVDASRNGSMRSNISDARTDLSDQVTIQPPEKYRERFLQAMEEYFLMVPDSWANPSQILRQK